VRSRLLLLMESDVSKSSAHIISQLLILVDTASFVVASIVGGTVYLFFLPETKGLNLEEVATVFQDVVVSTQKEGKTKAEGNIGTVHIEDMQKTEV
jgi:hypothetical protein